MVSTLVRSCLLGGLFSLPVFGATNCPLLGPDFPAPKNLSSSQTFQTALQNLTQLLSQSIASSNTSYGAFDTGNTSFSMEIFSTYEDTPLFSSQHSAPALATTKYGVKNVTTDTVFRIGSSTKLFAIYTFLIQAGDGHWHNPITKYIPELQRAAETLNATQNPIDHVAWEDITLQELASHLAGVGRDYAGLQELDGPLFPASNPSALGLPPLNVSEIVPCGGGSLCSRAQFFASFTNRHPVFAPGTTPIYSNAALQLLTYAFENITGIDMETMVTTSLINPLNLTSTSWSLPKSNATGILPAGNVWALPLGDETAAGGMYSSNRDLTTIARSILSSSLLPQTVTKRWMKPLSLTSAPDAFVGAPWEIYRVEVGLNNKGIDLYTKSGDLPGYSSMVILIPDFGVGFTVLTAGTSATVNSRILGGMLTDVMVGVIEDVAREEAGAVFSGTYSDSGLNSSISLEVDVTRPGLGVSNWVSNGTYMLSAEGVAASSVRLYPSGLERDFENGEKEMGFRAVFEDLDTPVVGGIFGNKCETWFGVDGNYWGAVAVDEFLIVVGKDGKAKSVTPRALRVELVRT